MSINLDDLATGEIERLARMVYSGTKQIDELPIKRRDAIAARVEQIAEEKAAEEKAKAAVAKKKGASRGKK